MPIVTFDTCIFINYQPSEFPKGFRLTAVVLQELVAGAEDDTELKYWSAFRRAIEKDGRFLVPSGDDWFEAGKTLNLLQRIKKHPKTGRIPPVSYDEAHRIIRDTLIARVCLSNKVYLVTDNLRDFGKIQRFCNVKIVSGAEYFGHERTGYDLTDYSFIRAFWKERGEKK